MDNLPADSAAKPPAKRGSAIESVKRGTMKALGKVRTEAGEAIEAAGASVERIHRRVMLVIGGLLLVLLLGAVFRAAGIPSANYALIALLGLGAIYALLQPMHLAGVLLVGGGVAAVRDLGSAGSALTGYARLLGRLFLALLIPLLLFALAPGDRSLGSSLPFIVLAPVVVLATWLFGRVAPRLETFVFVALPLAALLIAVSNMLIPDRMLAGLGVPAWLRTARPQDAELAAIETAIEKRKNEARAEQLRAIRRKVEAGEPLSAADEAVVADAKRERVTLTAWIDGQLKGIAEGLSRPERAEAAPPEPVPPAGGTLMLPTRLWSLPVKVACRLSAVLQLQSPRAMPSRRGRAGAVARHRPMPGRGDRRDALPHPAARSGEDLLPVRAGGRDLLAQARALTVRRSPDDRTACSRHPAR